jgi:hypothetical protein
MKQTAVERLLEQFKKMFVFVDDNGNFIDRGPR